MSDKPKYQQNANERVMRGGQYLAKEKANPNTGLDILEEANKLNKLRRANGSNRAKHGAPKRFVDLNDEVNKERFGKKN